MISKETSVFLFFLVFFRFTSRLKDPKTQRESKRRIERARWRAQYDRGRPQARRLSDSPQVVVLCVPACRNPIPRANSRECPHGNFRFPRSGRLYGSFRGVRLVPVNSLTSHSLDASAYGQTIPSSLLSLSPLSVFFKLVSSFSRLFLSIRAVHPRARRERRALVEAAVRRDTRKYTRARALVAFRCIFTPESSLPRCIFIRRE